MNLKDKSISCIIQLSSKITEIPQFYSSNVSGNSLMSRTNYFFTYSMVSLSVSFERKLITIPFVPNLPALPLF